MPLSISEIEKGAIVCDYWQLDAKGNPIKPKVPARLGTIVKVTYDDGSDEGVETGVGGSIKKIYVRYHEGEKPEVAVNQSLVLHRRADQTTQFELRHEQNNGLVQDATGRAIKHDPMKLNDAKHQSGSKVK